MESEITDLLSFYEVKIFSEERKGRDAEELEKAQEAFVAKDSHDQPY